MGAPVVKFDSSVPVLVLKIGRYPLSHGILGAIRSLGRGGVPVYAISEDRFVPYAFSRFLTGQVLLPTTGREEALVLVEELSRIAQRLGSKSILLPTDDEAAVFVAEHAATLCGNFVMPTIEPGLPRMLASKRGLSRLCGQHNVAIPATHFARSVNEVLAFARTAQFPMVIKNSEPWVRITVPAVKATTIVESQEALVSLASTWTSEPQVILQEYIPKAYAEDWIFHAYFDTTSNPLVVFTGFKQQSWPPYAGVTTAAIALPNADLAIIATAFCRAIGYRGVADMDWRLDHRDGRYKLLDFNPRVGANFRLFVSESGIDVVRAQHLDLTGRAVPIAPQVFGRRLVVENLYLASRLARGVNQTVKRDYSIGRTELAWFAADDPLPFFVMGLRFAGQILLRLAHLLVAMGKSATTRRRHRSKFRNSVRRL
jgi:predicted ATP-grasp superfamily ATP-dependent carboligase